MDMIKAAIYARVSTDSQSENSTTDQIRECQTYATKEGWAIYGTYVDEAISGSDVSRAEYSRLKADALAGRFQYIIVDDLSRIGRDMPEFTQLYQDLSEIGVFLVGVADGIDTSKSASKIPVYFKGIMNEMYLDDLKSKIVRGLKGQVLRGYSTGGRIYGYKTESVFDPSGAKDRFGRVRRLGCRILIDSDQADIVKRIFRLKSTGMGYKAIASILNSEKVPSPHANTGRFSGLWNPVTIRGILTNKKYTGVWEYNKTRWVKKRIKGKRKALPNKPSDWIKYESEDLRIIEDELFYTVNSQIQTAKRKPSAGRKKYPLSGVLKCAECGGALVVQRSGQHYGYMCNTARTKGPAACSSRHRIKRDDIESMIFSALIAKLTEIGAVNTVLERAKIMVNAHLGVGETNKNDLEIKMRKVESQIDNIVAAIEKGGYSPILHERLSNRENELRQIKAELKVAEIKPVRRVALTLDWLTDRLRLLGELIDGRDQKTSVLRNELHNLFPDSIMVQPFKAGNRIGFGFWGEAKPFALVFPQKVSKSKIAVQGLEPRTRGL